MLFKDGRGVKAREGKRRTRKRNLERVAEWVKGNPNGTPAQCAAELKLARNTVYSLAKELSENAEKNQSSDK